jgi:hypothetical protein
MIGWSIRAASLVGEQVYATAKKNGKKAATAEAIACALSQTQRPVAPQRERLAAATATGGMAAEVEAVLAAVEVNVTTTGTASRTKAVAPARGLKELRSGASWVLAVVPRLVLWGCS